MARNKLAKLLLEDNQAIQTAEGSSVSKFGLEQITDISSYLRSRIASWDRTKTDYDPLFEIAKLALITDDDNLAFRCHAELARYQYPQIRGLEIQSKEDKEVKIKIELAGFAKHTEGEIEDIEGEDIEEESEEKEAEYRYVDSVLKQAEKKDIS